MSSADYMVLLDGASKLGGDPKRFQFNLPADYVTGTKFAKPVLTCLIQPGPGTVSVEMYVNPSATAPAGHSGPFNVLTSNKSDEILRWNDGPEIDQATFLIINGTKLMNGAGSNLQNTIWFAAWKGTAVLKSVILWYQRDL